MLTLDDCYTHAEAIIGQDGVIDPPEQERISQHLQFLQTLAQGMAGAAGAPGGQPGVPRAAAVRSKMAAGGFGPSVQHGPESPYGTSPKPGVVNKFGGM
jgi:hypothetical protein